MWRGSVLRDGCSGKPGWFPADHVVLMDNTGMEGGPAMCDIIVVDQPCINIVTKINVVQLYIIMPFFRVDGCCNFVVN